MFRLQDKARSGLAAGTIAASLMLAAVSTPAQAASHAFALTGKVANGRLDRFDFGTTHYDQWDVELEGLNPATLPPLAAGDRVTVDLTLDVTLDVPASEDLTWYLVSLRGTGFDGSSTVTGNGTVEFKLQGAQVQLGRDTSCSTVGAIANCVTFWPPANGALSFDNVVFTFDIVMLATPVKVDSVHFSYTLFSPAVPEPSSWLLLAGGLCGLVGWRRSCNRAASSGKAA